MLAGAGVTTHSTRKVNAERLIEWLVSENAQKLVCPEHF